MVPWLAMLRTRVAACPVFLVRICVILLTIVNANDRDEFRTIHVRRCGAKLAAGRLQSLTEAQASSPFGHPPSSLA